MKIRISLFCFYFLLTLSVPTIRLAKIAMGCGSECGKEQRNEVPKGCRKGKCILSFNLSKGHFIAQEMQDISFNGGNSPAKKEKLKYGKNLISSYINIIWHPPKDNSFIRYITVQS